MAGGGAAAAPKQEDFNPHQVREQLPYVDYCLTSPPPWPEAVLLGFQHFLVMLGTSVIIPSALVPQMGGGNVIQTLLFVAGINTLTQTFFGICLPAIIRGSYTFVLPTISIILAGRYSDVIDPHEKFLRIMRGTQGTLIVASTLQFILGFSGLWRNLASGSAGSSCWLWAIRVGIPWCCEMCRDWSATAPHIDCILSEHRTKDPISLLHGSLRPCWRLYMDKSSISIPVESSYI